MAQAIRRSAREQRPSQRPFRWILIVAIIVVAIVAVWISILQQTQTRTTVRPTTQPTPVAQATPSAQPTPTPHPQYISQPIEKVSFSSATDGTGFVYNYVGVNAPIGTEFRAPKAGKVVIMPFGGGATYVGIWDPERHTLLDYWPGRVGIDSQLASGLKDGNDIAPGDLLFMVTGPGESGYRWRWDPNAHYQVVVGYFLMDGIPHGPTRFTMVQNLSVDLYLV